MTGAQAPLPAMLLPLAGLVGRRHQGRVTTGEAGHRLEALRGQAPPGSTLLSVLHLPLEHLKAQLQPPVVREAALQPDHSMPECAWPASVMYPVPSANTGA